MKISATKSFWIGILCLLSSLFSVLRFKLSLFLYRFFGRKCSVVIWIFRSSDTSAYIRWSRRQIWIHYVYIYILQADTFGHIIRIHPAETSRYTMSIYSTVCPSCYSNHTTNPNVICSRARFIVIIQLLEMKTSYKSQISGKALVISYHIIWIPQIKYVCP